MEALLTKTLMARNMPIINGEKLDKDKRWRYRSFNETNSRKEWQNKLKHLDYSIDSLSRRITLYVGRITRYFVTLMLKKMR